MNGKQRFLTALDGQQPDRVPVWVHAINERSIINIGKHLTDNVPELKAANHMTQAELMQLLDVLFLIHEELEIDGFTAQGMSQIIGVTNLDDNRFRDAWGTTWGRSEHGMAYMVNPVFNTPDDLYAYQPPAANAGEVALVDLARARFGDEKAVCYMLRGVFVRSWRLRGMQQLFVDMLERPQWVHALARMVTDYSLAVCEFAAKAGTDVLIVEDDIASNSNTLISPELFREFVAPYNKELVDCAHALGMKVMRHSDGNLWGIMDDLLAQGYDGLHPLDPQAGMTLSEVKAAVGNRICLLGNIDCGELLTEGSLVEVEDAVKQAIADAAPGGGHILCSSNSIHPGVKPENFLAMVRAAKQYGAY